MAAVTCKVTKPEAACTGSRPFAFKIFCLSGTMLHHAAFSIERAIINHYSETRFSIKRKLNFIIGGLWTFTLLWSLFPLFGWSAMFLKAKAYFVQLRDIAFVACILLFFCFVPIFAMVTAHYSIYHYMRKMTRNAHVMWGEGAVPTVEAIHAETKTARMAFMMSICFLFAWAPYAVVSLHAIILMPENISPLVATLPSLFAKTGRCYNPIIYFLLYNKFRASLGQTLRSLCGRFMKQDSNAMNWL